MVIWASRYVRLSQSPLCVSRYLGLAVDDDVGNLGQGANNINDGVLMVMSNMTTFQLSQDQSVLSVGPSFRFVYLGLDVFGTAVAKSRLDGVTSTDF